MAENIAFALLGIGLPDGFMIFVVSALPFMGVRAGMAIAEFIGFGVLRTLLVCLLGGLTPAPFVVIILRKALAASRRRGVVGSFLRSLRRALERGNRHTRHRLVVVMFAFAALPLPFTGVWASSVAAAMLGFDPRLALLAIAAGTFVNALLMLVLVQIMPGLFWI